MNTAAWIILIIACIMCPPLLVVVLVSAIGYFCFGFICKLIAMPFRLLAWMVRS